jgi:hypothetical protein
MLRITTIFLYYDERGMHGTLIVTSKLAGK